jgi:hypothetical protein
MGACSIFEIVMLTCFGISWPISIAKALRTHEVDGKSPGFMCVICVGYLSGILHKVFFAYDFVIWLYVFNFLLVSLDLWLYFRFKSVSD